MVVIQRSIRSRYCNIYRLLLLSFATILLLVFRQRTANKNISKDTHTSHQHNMENDNNMKEDVILPTVSYSLSAIVRTKKEGSNATKLEYALVHDKVDAAARKRAEEKAARKQQYTLVHEKPPRFVLFCHVILCVFHLILVCLCLITVTTSCTNISFYH